VDWPSYGFDQARSGYNPLETTLSTSTVGGLHPLWTASIGGGDGQPLFASGVTVGRAALNIVYAAAIAGSVYAINAKNGRTVWKRDFGTIPTGCGAYGIDGTMVFDRTTNRLYVPTPYDKIIALDMSTGATVPGWPVVVTADVDHEHIYSALTLWDAAIYVNVASYCDDSPYFGKIVRIDTTTATVAQTWLVTGTSPPGGGIWGIAGDAVDPAAGALYTATGNAISSNQASGYAEHVVRLDSSLNVVDSNYPGLIGADVDFGSTPMLYQAPGCLPQLVVPNKSGWLFVYDRDAIGAGPVQGLRVSKVGGTFQGVAAYDPVTNQVFIGNGAAYAPYPNGLLAFSVGADCQLTLTWKRRVASPGVTGTPTVANGVVYWNEGSAGQTLAFDAATGAYLWGSEASGTRWAGPIVANGRVIAMDADVGLHAYGL